MSNTAASVVLRVFRRVEDRRNLLHHSPRLKNAYVRQVKLDKWLPLTEVIILLLLIIIMIIINIIIMILLLLLLLLLVIIIIMIIVIAEAARRRGGGGARRACAPRRLGSAIMTGWRNTVEIILFEISISCCSYVYTGKLKPGKCLFEPQHASAPA